MKMKLVALSGSALLLLGLAGVGVVLIGGRHTSQDARAAEPDTKLDADKIGAAAGTKATTTPDGVVRIGWPRTDVAVEVDGMPLKPFAGLGSWAAFTPAK